MTTSYKNLSASHTHWVARLRKAGAADKLHAVPRLQLAHCTKCIMYMPNAQAVSTTADGI